jgi:hypothetical protein
MPSIADSLKGAGYLGDVGDAFKKTLLKFQQDKEQEQFNQSLGDAFKQMQDVIRPTGEDVNSQQTGSNATRLSEFMPQGMGNNVLPESQNTNNTPQAPKSLNDIANLRTSAPVKAYGEMSPAEQQKYHMGILADTMMKSEQFKNLDPKMKERMLQALQMKAQSIEPDVPTSKLQAFKTDEDLYLEKTDKSGGTSYSKMKSGQAKPKLSSSSTIQAQEDDPQGRYKKGDDIVVRLDENDPDSKQVYVGKADTTTKDVAKARLEIDKGRLSIAQGELGLKVKEFNQKLKEKDPNVVLQSGKAVIDAIDEQLKTVNQYTDEAGYNALVKERINTIAKIKQAQMKLQQNPASQGAGTGGKPKISF